MNHFLMFFPSIISLVGGAPSANRINCGQNGKNRIVTRIKCQQIKRSLFGRWPHTSKANPIFSIVVRITVTATLVYTMLRERDARLFYRRSRNFKCILSEILFWIRSKVNSIESVCDSSVNRSLTGF